jgi:hypothetical protein
MPTGGGGDVAPADSGADASVRLAGRTSSTQLNRLFLIVAKFKEKVVYTMWQGLKIRRKTFFPVMQGQQARVPHNIPYFLYVGMKGCYGSIISQETLLSWSRLLGFLSSIFSFPWVRKTTFHLQMYNIPNLREKQYSFTNSTLIKKKI